MKTNIFWSGFIQLGHALKYSVVRKTFSIHLSLHDTISVVKLAVIKSACMQLFIYKIKMVGVFMMKHFATCADELLCVLYLLNLIYFK
jgi:hypothetical protein